MAFTTIPSRGVPGNRHSGGSSGRWPGDSSCPTVVFATSDSRSPGGYRYDPASYDPSVPDSDPRSPRYEPPHLRHQPGDTWIIDRERPRDPLDPGPFGSPGWRPDERTGRHRRGEVPDPGLPGLEPVRPAVDPAFEGVDEEPSPIRRPVRRFLPSAGGQEPEPRSEPDRESPTGAGRQADRGWWPRPSASPEPEADNEPSPPPRRRRWDDADRPRYNFGKLREDAWVRFLEGSQQFHDEHSIKANHFGIRFARFLRALFAVLRTVVSVDRTEWGPADPLRPPTAVTRRPRPFPGGSILPMSVTPGQGDHRTRPSGSFVLDWERHFDAAQGFREAVVL